VKEGLSDRQLAIFDLIERGNLSKKDREKIKQASRELLDEIVELIKPIANWTAKEQTQAEVQTFILDHIYSELPDRSYSLDDKQVTAELVYQYILQQGRSGIANQLG